jgi:hypothetical protein
MTTFQGLIDKPFYVGHIKNFDKMVTELSPYMTEIEIDQCISYMHTLKDTKWDINPSPEDCKTQLQIMLGRDRFLELTKAWGQKNQKFLSVFGTMKYRLKSDGSYWDGLDETDNEEDYEKVYI